MRSKSQTTTGELGRKIPFELPSLEHNALVERRLPKQRPPTHPGRMLLEEFLKPLDISQTKFANQLDISPRLLNTIIRGKRSVTANIALRLAQVTGMSADFWLDLQLKWDLWHALHSEEMGKITSLKPLDRVSEVVSDAFSDVVNCTNRHATETPQIILPGAFEWQIDRPRRPAGE